MTVAVGQVRRRISYDLRVVGFLGLWQTAVLEGVEDGRRTTVATAEVASWPVVFEAGEEPE